MTLFKLAADLVLACWPSGTGRPAANMLQRHRCPGPAVRTQASRTRVKVNSRFDALPSPAMTTPPGWEPRPGPTRGGPARRAPRGAGGWPQDGAEPRRQAPRNGEPPSGRDRESGPRFTPSRPPVPRDGTPVNQRAPRPGEGGREQGGREQGGREQGGSGQGGSGQGGRGSGPAGP